MTEVYDVYKPAPVKAKKTQTEPMISIRLVGEDPTPEVPLSVVSAALDGVSGKGKRGKNKSAPMREVGVNAGVIAAGELRAFIERVERLEEEKKTISDDIKQVFAEMKGSGFDTKTVRTIIRMRKKELHERQEEQAILDLYLDALGMF